MVFITNKKNLVRVIICNADHFCQEKFFINICENKYKVRDVAHDT